MGSRARLWTATILAGLVGGYAFAWSPSSAPEASDGQEASAQQAPSVRVARRIIEAAGALDAYVRTAGAVRSEFDGADAVSAALVAGSGYDARQLDAGVVAYAALVALQEPAFVDSLMKMGADPAERTATVDRLTASPELVLEIEGAPRAAALASAALNDMGAKLVGRGKAVKEAAYTVQREPWALEPVAQPADRLAQVEAAGAKPVKLSDDETRQLLAGIVARRRADDDSVSAPPPTATVTRGLVLAAAAVLGQAGDDRADALSPLLSEPRNAACLRRAKINLHQCVASSGPNYEDVFCAGQHAILETGQCIVKAAGGGGDLAGVKVPVARSILAPAAQSIAVPVARSLKAIFAPPAPQAPPPAAKPKRLPVVDEDGDVDSDADPG